MSQIPLTKHLEHIYNISLDFNVLVNLEVGAFKTLILNWVFFDKLII